MRRSTSWDPSTRTARAPSRPASVWFRGFPTRRPSRTSGSRSRERRSAAPERRLPPGSLLRPLFSATPGAGGVSVLNGGSPMASDVYAGKDLGTLDLTITAEMVDHYIKGLDEPNPWYTTASPLGGPVAPVIVYQQMDTLFKGWHLDNLFGNLWRRQEW